MRLELLLGCCSLVIAASGGLGVAGHDDSTVDPEKFISQYRPALSKLEQFYSQSRCRGVEIVKYSLGGRTIEFEFAVNGDRYRLVRALKEFRRTDEVGITTAVVADPRLSFDLQRVPSRNDFAVQWVGISAGEMHKKRVEKIRWRAQFAFAAFSVCDVPITELQKWEGFSIQNVVPVQRDGHDLLKVSFMSTSPYGLSYGGWFAVCPHCAWAVHEYEVRQHKPGVDDATKPMVGRGHVEYWPADRDIPLVRRVELNWSRDNQVAQQFECNFTEFRHEVVPEEEFTLAAFGIPQPEPLVGVPPLAFWGLLLATIAFVCSVMLRLRRGHRRET